MIDIDIKIDSKTFIIIKLIDKSIISIITTIISVITIISIIDIISTIIIIILKIMICSNLDNDS